MGFLKSFFAALVANEISEKKRLEQEQTKSVKDSCRNVDKILAAERDFLDYLRSINCNNAEYTELISDSQIENGITTSYDVFHAQQIIDKYKQQLKEFINLGGNPAYIYDLNKMDLHIEIIKRLKEYGWLDKQSYYIKCSEDLSDLEFAWDIEQQRKMFKEVQEDNSSYFAYEEINSLSGVEFEQLCKILLENMGFSVETTKASGDGGIDLIAYNSQPLLSGKYIIQCKRYTGSVGEPIIRDLYGVVTAERANKGILMTTGQFTKSAIAFSNAKPIELIDGEKLKVLLANYGICEETVLEDEIPIKEVFESNIMIEDMYDYYMDNIQTLSLTNNEMSRSEFINQLLEWTLSEGADISDFNHKLVIFKEIKNQIIQYLKNPRSEKSKYLAYLYQMVFIQISILQGNFKDAVTMFSKLIEHEELQIDETEAFEPVKTKELLNNHIAIFSCMYYTYFDMCQIAALLEDKALSDDLFWESKYYGYQLLSLSRIKRSIEHYKQQGEDREKYWLGELEAYNSREKLYCLYLMSNYEPQMYFNYVYHGGKVSDVLLDRHSISLEDNTLVIDEIGTVENINKKIKNYNKFNDGMV